MDEKAQAASPILAAIESYGAESAPNLPVVKSLSDLARVAHDRGHSRIEKAAREGMLRAGRSPDLL